MKKTFTLIELLVVVAIIGIIAAMLLPALNSVREKSNIAKCKSYLKQHGLALGSYFSGDGVAYTPAPSGVLSTTSPVVIALQLDEKMLTCSATSVNSTNSSYFYSPSTVAGHNGNIAGLLYGVINKANSIIIEDDVAHKSTNKVSQLRGDGHVEEGSDSN